MKLKLVVIVDDNESVGDETPELLKEIYQKEVFDTGYNINFTAESVEILEK